MEKVEKTKIKKFDKEKVLKRVMAGTLAFLMVLSVALTLIGCLVAK